MRSISSRCSLDALFLVAHSYAWSEFLEEPRGFRTNGHLLQAIAPLDGLIQMIGDGLASTLLVPFDTSLKYDNWFQSIRTAGYQLPDRYVQDGGIGFSVVKDHPSDLFRRSELMGVDNDTALEHLVHRLNEWRRDEVRKLISILDQIRAGRQ